MEKLKSLLHFSSLLQARRCGRLQRMQVQNCERVAGREELTCCSSCAAEVIDIHEAYVPVHFHSSDDEPAWVASVQYRGERNGAEVVLICLDMS